jgi:hypothetical protein
MYNTVLREVLDKHAHIKFKTITVHPVAPWYIDEIMAAKKGDKKGKEDVAEFWLHSA